MLNTSAPVVLFRVLCFLTLTCLVPAASAQTRILCIGDSITNGGGGPIGQYNGGGASWRYPLYFQLVDAGYNINFVGTQNGYFITPPNVGDYPRIANFDPDHDGYWGAPTSSLLSNIDNIANSTQPNIALIHLGTNDLSVTAGPNPTAAAQNLQSIIGRLRAQNPSIKILIAQLVPIDPIANANYDSTRVSELNALIMSFAASLHTTASPIVVVDQYSDYDYLLMHKDGIHPNLAGEVYMGQSWFAPLKKLLDGAAPIQPVIAHQPKSRTLSAGANVTLSIGAAGHAPITYQWKRNGTNVGSATSPVLSLTNITTAQAGTYTCVVTTPQNSITSAAATIAVGTAVPIVAQGAQWRYLDNGSDQGTAWRTLSFNDSSWLIGAAQLGYGDGDETTVVQDNPTPGYTSGVTDRYITTYFRRTFNVTGVANFSSLRLRLLRDDGAIVYLNGTEVFRTNMLGHPGILAYNTPSRIGVGGTDETTYFEPSIHPPASLLVEGNNVLAVEVHQASADSSDVSFNLELTGTLLGYPEWRFLNFGTLSNTGSSADTADFDKDGVSNFLEYALAGNPSTASFLTLPSVQNANNLLSLSYTRPIAATDLTYTIETATSVTGPWSAAGVTLSTVSDNGTLRSLRGDVSTSGATKFLHLKVTRP